MKSLKIKYPYPLLKIFWIIMIASCDYNENKNASAEKLQSTESEINSLNSTITQESIKKDTVYKDFIYEEYIGFYRFGMTLSEWNKRLAELAKNKIITSLSKLNSTENPRFVYDSYQGFFELNQNDKTTEHGPGCYVRGLFEKVNYHQDTVEIFRLNGHAVNEPILIGIQIDFDINLSSFNEIVNSMIANDNLKFIAGSIPLVLNNHPVSKEDFPIGVPPDLIGENMNAAIEQYNSDNNPNRSLSSSFSNPAPRKRIESFNNYFKILYSTNNYYMTIEVEKTTSAFVQRSNEINNYEILFIEGGHCNYKLTQKKFSKTQSRLNIEDYMTREELTKYKQSIQTKKLIDEALNK
jgi:hypothetical protein